MAAIEKPKKRYLVKALGNTLTDQSSWLVLLGLCGRYSKMCQNRTFRPSVGYDNDDVIGPNFFCELIGSMSSFFKIKFCSTREKPHPTVSCYLNSSNKIFKLKTSFYTFDLQFADLSIYVSFISNESRDIIGNITQIILFYRWITDHIQNNPKNFAKSPFDFC